MSLLEKAIGGKKNSAPPKVARSSLFARASLAYQDNSPALPEEEILTEPAAEEPLAEEPLAEEPLAEEPLAEEPFAEEPLAEEPLAEEPLAEEPLAEEPLAEEPLAEEPLAEEPLAEEELPPENVASSGEELTPFTAELIEELKGNLATLPSSFDSILLSWFLLSQRLPVAAISLFLPKGDFLSLAACAGFPAGSDEDIPLSLAPSVSRSCELLEQESKALIAPLLGVPLTMPLRASSIVSETGCCGLWVYHDEALETSSEEVKERLVSLFAQACTSFPASSMACPSTAPERCVLEAARKYSAAVAFRFDFPRLSSLGEALRSVSLNAFRSVFLSACERLLAQNGLAVVFGETSVACLLGSSSSTDADLALFQFTKTLRRILPFLSSAVFPEGRGIVFDPSSDRAIEDLTGFFSE